MYLRLFGRIIFFVLLLLFIEPSFCLAMPIGTLLFRTSQNAKMYGYSNDPLIYVENALVKNIYSGHVGIYIGKENGVDYVVEALGGGIVKNPAKYFVNRAEGETFLGARLPRGVKPLQQAKIVALAKSLVSRQFAYDFDFKHQKGPGSGEWTCVGLSEKLYESANISNPNNLASLEYDPEYYAIDITPDGFDNKSIINESGDCFSKNKEYSKISRMSNVLIPAPELIGFDVGLEYEGERYVFLPYTQFLQPILEPVPVDIDVASSFSGTEIRGAINTTALALRWSLVNNPISSFKRIVDSVKDLSSNILAKSKELITVISQKISGSNNSDVVIVDDNGVGENILSSTNSPASKSATTSPRIAQVNKQKVSKNNGAVATSNSSSVNIKNVNNGIQKNTQSLKITTSTLKIPVVISKKIAEPLKKTSTSTSVLKIVAAKTTSSPVISPTTAKIRPIVKAPATTNKATSSSSLPAASVSSAVSHTSSSGTASSNSASSISSGSGSGSSSNQANNLAIINKIYNTADNYWVELYNPTDHDFDLATAGYRLEKTKTAEDPSLIVRLGNTDDATYPGGTIIKSHSKYLIVSNKANVFYKNKADALVLREDFFWSGSDYTLYLGNAAISSSADPNIIEAVGFGSGATYFEGAGPAPAIKDNYILNRIATSSNNNLDFNLIPSDDPDLKSILNTFSTSTENIASTSSSTSPINNSSSSDEIIASSTNSSSSLATSTDNSSDNTSSGDSFDWRKLALISKIYSTGNNDWIELFNASNQDLDLALAEYRLEKAKTVEDPSLMLRFAYAEDALYPGGTIIKANSSYMIVRNDASPYYKEKADAIALRSEFSWTDSGYTMYLGNGAISSSTDPNIIDKVGFGSDAIYFEGSGPALAIKDNYILNRIATTGNNNLDFSLIPSDDPEVLNNFDASNSPYLFAAPEPINSSGLTDIWHFDECAGVGKWAVGRWDCARQVGFQSENFIGTLNQAISQNNFSLSFYYHRYYEYPRVNLRLYNEFGSQITLIVEPDLVTLDGLPNSDWRYYINNQFDDNWHQITLVVNQDNDYWAVYIDGQERIKTDFLARLSTISNFELSGNCGTVLVDELAVWNRSLLPAEISSYYSSPAPFSPIMAREPQKVAKLNNLWNFEEDTGSTAQDSIQGLIINAPQAIWTGRNHNNYAISTVYGQNFTTTFPIPIISQDLSLAFWYRNSAYPNPGRAHIYLNGGPNNDISVLSLLADPYRLAYIFNGAYGVLAEGNDAGIPADALWHYLALVYDSYRYKLIFYVDGEEKASTSLIRMPEGEEIMSLLITTNSYGAEIDNLGIYKGALNPLQVKTIYAETK